MCKTVTVHSLTMCVYTIFLKRCGVNIKLSEIRGETLNGKFTSSSNTCVLNLLSECTWT